MKFGNLFKASFLMLVLVLTALAVTSCNLEHEHSFSAWETVTEPTCTAFGLQKRTCECAQTEYGTLAALAHDPITDEGVAATCTELGKAEGSHCRVCGAVITAQTETSKLSHSFSEWETVTEPTCTAFGLKKRACKCGLVEYDAVEALAHTPVTDEAVGASCTEYGKTEGSHCGACNTVILAQSIIAPLGHNCDEITVLEEAFCNSDGVKRFSCSNTDCDYYYDESYSIPELDANAVYLSATQYVGVIKMYNRFGDEVGAASAFVISADGKIATSNLNIENAFSAIFVLGEDVYNVTEVLAFSEMHGAAVLKIDATDLPYATLCTSDPIDGETVYSVGAPEGLVGSISLGIISNADRYLNGVSCIQHDADMYPGYSGGPLVNRYGEVIGINADVIGESGISYAVRISALDELDYSCPISMEEYGNITFTPTEQLNNWVFNNYNATNNNLIAYVIQGNGFYYSLGYDQDNNYSYVEGYWIKDTVYQLYIRVIIDNYYGVYQYYATLTDGVRQNEVNGYIEADYYTAETILTYDTYYGKYWNEAELLALYSTAVYDTLGFFSYCLDTYFLDINLETFFFLSLSYEKDAEALDKLNGFVEENGVFNESSGAYEISMNSPVGENTAVFNLSYIPESADALASTVATIDYYMANGALYRVSLCLDPTEDGNRFDVMYAVYNGSEFVVQSVGWGYLDANSLTGASKLHCYVFNGMNEYEDGLLMDYASYLSYLMDWLNYVVPNVSPELSLKDLGFFFYFG